MKRALQDIYQRFATRRMFTRWTPSYEQDVSASHYSAADRVAACALVHLAKADTLEPRVADIGIGTGLVAQQIFEAMPCSITGIDFTEDMMALCSSKGITELLLKLDAGKDPWPLPAQGYDSVVSAGLLEYFSPSMLQHLVQQSFTALKPGGWIISTYLPSDEGENRISTWNGKSGRVLSFAYDPSYIEGLLNASGFSIHEHSEPFSGSRFRDGSHYDYRLFAAQKPL